MANLSETCVYLLLILLITVGCHSTCEIQGSWSIKHGQITRNSERVFEGFSENEIIFKGDEVILSSGFFYNTLSVDEEYLVGIGRFPFAYYGKREKYRIIGDSLSIYSNPYKLWDSFKMQCLGRNKMLLLGMGDSILLKKNHRKEKEKICSIKYVKAHVYELGLGLYNIDYRVSYLDTDTLIYENLKNQSESTKTFNLGEGAFAEMCEDLSRIDLKSLKDYYPTSYSEMIVVELEIGLESKDVIRIKLENTEYPEELYFALIPILYGHQQFVYPDLQPVWK